MLTLPIKKKWFDMILSGEKKEEYRARNGYYHSRFENIGLLNNVLEPSGQKCWIRLRNGYSKESPTAEVKVGIRLGEGRPEWGAEPGMDYWVLEILEIGKTYNIDECARCRIKEVCESLPDDLSCEDVVRIASI